MITKMKFLSFILLLMISLTMSLVNAPAQQTGFLNLQMHQVQDAWEEKQQMYDCRQISAIWNKYCRAVCENDGKAFISLHELDAYKMPPNSPMFCIRDVSPSLQTNWDKTREKMDIKMEIDCCDIVISGDYAWSMGTYLQSFIPKNGEPATTFNGKFLTVFHRQPNGKWKICRDCFNSNDPPSI